MKVGDLVKILGDERFDDTGLIGLVQWVDTQYPPQCGLLVKGNMKVYDTRAAEVISENR